MAQDNSDFLPEPGGNEAILHLKQAIVAGKPWHLALLEAIKLWPCPEETHNDHHYCYLIDSEAFNWLLLAQRLCQEIDGLIPEQELNDLLFFGKMPENLSKTEFRDLIGNAKYQAYLNYLYGVTVENFLQFAVEEEIHKERQALIFSQREDDLADSYQRIYGSSQTDLLRLFRKEKGYTQSRSLTLKQLDEFTYWLFKYRLNNCDKARIASDTKKALEYLKLQRLNKRRLLDGKRAANVTDSIINQATKQI
ncbi:hypothetical protein ACFLWV_03725 [Chloroflexota bacterium]